MRALVQVIRASAQQCSQIMFENATISDYFDKPMIGGTALNFESSAGKSKTKTITHVKFEISDILP